MPTAFTHIFVAETLSKTVFQEKMPLRFWVLIAVCSVLPDIDIIGYYFGIKYSSVFGHRGFFHSFTFALLAGVLVVVLAFPAIARFSRKWWMLLAIFFVVTASHGFLDSMTERGLGVGFFIPFDNTRYFMFWRPVYASPMPVERFFSSSGLHVLVQEILWIWIPVFAVYLTLTVLRKRRRNAG